jgi:hypothetical protein
MAFAQVTWRGAARCCTGLNAKPEARYRLGFGESVTKPTLTDASEQRNWRLGKYLAKNLMHKTRTLSARADPGLELENTVYGLDFTTKDLSNSLFSRASPRRTKAGLKMSNRLSAADHNASLPAVIMFPTMRAATTGCRKHSLV